MAEEQDEKEYVIITKERLEAIGSAIRAKNGEISKYKIASMPAKIAAIETGVKPEGTLVIEEPGIHRVGNLSEKYAYEYVNVDFISAEGEEQVISNPVFDENNQIVITPSKDNVLIQQVTIEAPPAFQAENIKQGIQLMGITGTFVGNDGIELPRLNTPIIARNQDTITVTNPATNGTFGKKFILYNGTEAVNIAYSSGTASVPANGNTSAAFLISKQTPGTYNFQAVVGGNEHFIESSPTSVIPGACYTYEYQYDSNEVGLSGNSATYADFMPVAITFTSKQTGHFISPEIKVKYDGELVSKKNNYYFNYYSDNNYNFQFKSRALHNTEIEIGIQDYPKLPESFIERDNFFSKASKEEFSYFLTRDNKGILGYYLTVDEDEEAYEIDLRSELLALHEDEISAYQGKSSYSVTNQYKSFSYDTATSYNGYTGWWRNDKLSDNQWAVCRLSFTSDMSRVVNLIWMQTSEQNYDYGGIGNLNTPITSWSACRMNSSSLQKDFRTFSFSTPQTYSFTIPAGSSFVDICYSKDGSATNGWDAFLFRISGIEFNANAIGSSYLWSLAESPVMAFSDAGTLALYANQSLLTQKKHVEFEISVDGGPFTEYKEGNYLDGTE